ncbi:MAG: ABC transporter permease [Chitinophagaceae bacterium]|nr:ABC transporter permease [Chitinophagaceae bacterium]
MRNIIEIARVFFILFMRDKVNLFFSFFFNAFLMIMLGLFVNNRFDEVGTVGIYDTVNSDFSHEFVDVLQQIPNLKVKLYNDTTGLVEGIRKGDLVAGIRLNKSFESLKDSSFRRQPGEEQINLYGNSGKEFWIKMLEPGLQMTVLHTNAYSSKLIGQIRIGTQMIQARNLDYFKFIFPAVLVFSIMGLAFTGASSLLFFRKADVLKRLKITPLKKYEFLTGFVISYLLLLFLQVILYILIAWLVFGYTFTGNYLQIAMLIAGCSLLFLVLGIVIANLVPSVDSGNNIIRFLNFPASFLCGIFLPTESLPRILRWFSVAHPLTYFARAIRNVVNYSASFHENLSDYSILAIILVVVTVVSVTTFKWEEQVV